MCLEPAVCGITSGFDNGAAEMVGEFPPVDFSDVADDGFALVLRGSRASAGVPE
jgi:hypothetical protein